MLGSSIIYYCNFAKILRHELTSAINKNCKPIVLLIYGKWKLGVSHAFFNCEIEVTRAVLRYLKGIIFQELDNEMHNIFPIENNLICYCNFNTTVNRI